MPAAAVASRTPAIAGMSGTVLGASGETVAAMALIFVVYGRAYWLRGLKDVDARGEPGHDAFRIFGDRAKGLSLRRAALGRRRRRFARRRCRRFGLRLLLLLHLLHSLQDLRRNSLRRRRRAGGAV